MDNLRLFNVAIGKGLVEANTTPEQVDEVMDMKLEDFGLMYAAIGNLPSLKGKTVRYFVEAILNDDDGVFMDQLAKEAEEME